MDVNLLEVVVVLSGLLAGTLFFGWLYVLGKSREAERRSLEFALLAEIGSVVSSKLDPDAVLHAIHGELSKFFDTSAFYVAFLDEETGRVRFEFETEEGQVVPKRSRDATNGFTEHIIHTGRPLLIKRSLESVRDRLGVSRIARPSRCFCGVPIFLHGRTAGVMAALHYEKENVYQERDLEILQVAARQVAVAFENARLFAAEQKRARYLAFINNLSKTAISTQHAEEMLATIMGQIQQTFPFDHISVGLVDYNTKDIELRAVAGPGPAVGTRIPLGAGIVGRAARKNEVVLEQDNPAARPPAGLMPGAMSVLCLPITYGSSLLGILNVESRQQHAYSHDDALMLRTLADLLATALHNVFVFRRLEQQSITDGLTGVKTRRYFNEALQSEFSRGVRSGRPFSVVLIDLDKFKDVNDSMGHLEGDLVLARLGRLLEQKVRQSNIVARYGGDEFTILMPETNADQACMLSERLRLWVATDPMLAERRITGSFGVAEYPTHGLTVEDVVKMADAAMYSAKRAGGNRVAAPDFVADAGPLTEQRKIIATHLEGLLQREHFASQDEILSALGRIAAAVPRDLVDSTMRQAVRMITRAVETRELHAGHGDTVASYVAAIADELAFEPAEREDLIFAAQVHDVGKIVVPEALLQKAGSLTFEEYQVMKQHPAVGGAIVSMVPNSERIRKFVRQHQEQMNGAGYPDGIAGERISLGARVISAAEAFVNMISDKPYAEGKSHAEAMYELEQSAPHHFDETVVKALIAQLRGARAARA